MGIAENIKNQVFAIFGQDQTDIDLISGIVDIYPEENHSLRAIKTKYPVEDGSSRTDNFVIEPKALILKGLVSDLQIPLIPVVSIANNNRSKEAWGRLEALLNSGELCSVITQLGIYENMMVVSVDSSVSRDTGRALNFTITLEEVLIAETETVQLAPAKLDGPASTKGSDSNGGLKQAEELSENDGTILKDIAAGIGGLF